ncbi:MAG: PAS domain S-box protein [Syntrophobacterales bacterium]|nr:PAS domain S-box protein [Syntrophobacterales bacterium]
MPHDERTLRAILEGSPIPTFVIGKDHRVIYWNRALEELSKIKAEDVIGTREQWRAFYRSERPCMADLIVDETLETVPDWYSGKYNKSGLIDEAYEATDFFPELGKEGRWLRFTAAAIRDAAGELVGAIETLEDITERKKAEEELANMKRLESLGQFADSVARDFDSLLSAILRSIFLVKVSVTDDDRVMEEILAVAEKAGLQAKELTHWLITFAGGGYLLRKTTDLRPLLKEAVTETLAGSHIRVRFTFPEDLWFSDVDDRQIRKVFQHIVLNAREAMPGGGVIDVGAKNVTVKAGERGTLGAGNYVEVSFQDEGCGIAKENIAKIFDPYFTTKAAKGEKGIGLGLAVSYSIVKNHKGLITVESELGRETTLHVFLPASPQTGVA